MFLERILAAKRSEVEARRAVEPPDRLAERARRHDAPRGFAKALARCEEAVAVIAEMKKASPSKGVLREWYEPQALAVEYAAGGAAALSVLTDGTFFEGSLDDLGRARAASGLPVLRKDFLIDPWQVLESRAAGADAVLLIARILEPARLAEMHRAALELGMDALVEVRDERELDAAIAAGARVMGVNARDLDTFEVDPSRLDALAPKVPQGVLLVAESGIRSAADIARAVRLGARAVLIGEALVASHDPQATLASWLEAL